MDSMLRTISILMEIGGYCLSESSGSIMEVAGRGFLSIILWALAVGQKVAPQLTKLLNSVKAYEKMV